MKRQRAVLAGVRERSALALLLPVALTACKSVEPTHGVPPFLEFYPTPSSITAGESPGEEVFVRPFFSYETWRDAEASWRQKAMSEFRRIDSEGERAPDPSRESGAPAGESEETADLDDAEGSALRILFPFYISHSGPRREYHQLAGIFRYSSRRKLLGGEDWDWMLFPILYGGGDPDEGGYFGIFPLGGKLKGLIGQDEIDFWLFPLYWSQRDGEKVSTHWVWPFGNYVEGGGWSGWRIWPFFGEYAWDTPDGRPRSRRRTIVWPFYQHNRDWLQEDPTESFFSFPFYGYRESSRSRTETYFWPFYVRYRDKRQPERDMSGGFLLPWRWGEDHHDIWPFWGTKREVNVSRFEAGARERFRQYAVWPFQRYDWSHDSREETSRLWVLPFFWRFEYDRHDPDLEDRLLWRLWPLVAYRRQGATLEIDAPAVPWWTAEREDWHRAFDRLFAIYRYRAREGYRGFEVLYGTIYWGSGQRTESEPAEDLFSVLGGLFEVGTRNDSLVLRFLWIPWW